MTMVRVRQVPAGEFKAQCLKLIDEVNRSRTPLVITKHGKPVTQLVPVGDAPPGVLGCMKDTAEIRGALLDAVASPDDWEALG